MAPKKNGVSKAPHLIPQPNGGALNSGGTPGNKGGTGRPPNLVRQLAREKVYAGIPHIAKLMTDAKRDADQIAAFAALARLGIPNQVEVGENPDAPLLSLEERITRAKALLGH